MMKNDELKTEGIILRRTNYGEADRILNIITPAGKVAAIAKSVRKPKSKLAGGVEMFCLSELVVHRGKGELGIITSARMKAQYGEIVKDFERMEKAAEMLKKIDKAAEGVGQGEFFEILKQSLEALNKGVDLRLAESWFVVNFRRVSGEEMNLYRDNTGEKLAEEKRYDWNGAEEVFMPNESGEVGAEEIKMLRLMATMDLVVVRRVKTNPELTQRIYGIIKKWES